MSAFYYEKESTHSLSGIRFKTEIKEYLFRDAEGMPEASLYSYSYIEKPTHPDKPVMFCYNGGPGASSSWVHMGLLGPKQVTFPDHPEGKRIKYGENGNFILDCCDLVMINPPGTKYTFIKENVESKYYNTVGDAEAVGTFICDWLKKHRREEAPVYLLGESYGTLRNLAVAKILTNKVNFSGIVSIGTSFNVGSPTTMLVEPNVRRLGANAACCWYHFHRDELDQRQFIAEAMNFSYGEYAHALLMGKRLPDKEFESTLEKLHYYTGLEKELLREGNLRFDEITFLTKLIPGQLVSAYDSRMTRPLLEEMTAEQWEEEIASEPFFAFADNAITAALERYTKEDLEEPKEHSTEYDMLQIALKWDYKALKDDTLTLPVELMEGNEKLRFFFVAGYYDLQSTFDFVTYYLGRYNLPMDRITFRIYDSGHASYAGGNAANEICEDIRSFIKADTILRGETE
ncbi:MAG: hypothetical protein LIO94_12535 [Clostridiales bacterium]|nr:hypothetical protein [Clostridiales bacterium]